MKKGAKIWLAIAALFIITGAVLFTFSMAENSWDFSKLSTQKLETNTHEITADFSDILIDSTTADIIFKQTDDNKCRVECYEDSKEKHSVSVQNGALSIKTVSEKAWYDYIGINFNSPKVTIYLPKTEYKTLAINEDTGDVEIPKDFKFESIDIVLSTGDVSLAADVSGLIKTKTDTGDIKIEDISAGALKLSVSTGHITATDVVCNGDINISVSTGKTALRDISCKNLLSSGNTGDISLNNVLAKERLELERSTGDINFSGSDADGIFIETDTGDVKGSLLSDKVFIAKSDTGKVDVPKTASGGKCEITTDTGSIKITIEKP